MFRWTEVNTSASSDRSECTLQFANLQASWMPSKMDLQQFINQPVPGDPRCTKNRCILLKHAETWPSPWKCQFKWPGALKINAYAETRWNVAITLEMSKNVAIGCHRMPLRHWDIETPAQDLWESLCQNRQRCSSCPDPTSVNTARHSCWKHPAEIQRGFLSCSDSKDFGVCCIMLHLCILRNLGPGGPGGMTKH